MKKAVQEKKGTLPGYMPEKKAQRLSNQPFGMRRRLSLSEEGDMLLVVGDNRKAIANMTPGQLKEIADLTADQSDLLLGQ